MEPRPPQTRSSRPFELPGSPETAGIGERLYPTPGEPASYPGADAYPPGAAAEPPLLPRRQRRQRGALRGIAVAMVALGALVAVGWFFRDAVRGFVDPPAATPTVAAMAVDPGTPTAEPESAALPNALSTVTPTPAASAAVTTEPVSEDESVAADPSAGETGANPAGDDVSSETMPLLDLLPTLAQVPEGFVVSTEAERTRSEVVTSLGGTDEAAQLLDEWGWSGNAVRDFTAVDPSAVDGAAFIFVSVHRLADAESAENAMIFFADQGIFLQALQEVEAPAVGDSARLLTGSSDGVPVTVLYAQQGSIVYRIFGSSQNPDTDPTADVLAVAGQIVPGQAPGG